ncbi:MAG: PepSY domain-containing protein [Opitutaceae bacterium]|nr:PepSY domain-containing protein [Opitutaceae bacterium]
MKNLLPLLSATCCLLALVIGTASWLSFQEASNTALATARGRICRSKIAIEHGNLVYSFIIAGSDLNMTEVRIDASNGTVLGARKAGSFQTKKGHGGFLSSG